MKKLNISSQSFSTYQNIIRYDINRRYKNAKVDKEKVDKIRKETVSYFTRQCKSLAELYNKLGYNNVEVMNMRIDFMENYFKKSTRNKDLSYRKIIDKLYKNHTFWAFFVGLWLERDITFYTEKLGEYICFSTGEKKLVYTEWNDTGIIEVDNKADLQFVYEGYQRREIKKMGYECLKFIDKYIDYEQEKMGKETKQLAENTNNKRSGKTK